MYFPERAVLQRSGPHDRHISARRRSGSGGMWFGEIPPSGDTRGHKLVTAGLDRQSLVLSHFTAPCFRTQDLRNAGRDGTSSDL